MVTLECVEKLIKKDMLDPINSQPLKSSDIITLQRVSKLIVPSKDNFPNSQMQLYHFVIFSKFKEASLQVV